MPLPTENLETVFRRVHSRLRPRTPLPTIEARFFPSVAANHSAELEDGTLRLRVSDLFDDAPEDVLEALAMILLSRLYRKKVAPEFRERYRAYTLTPDMLERSRQTRRRRGRRRRRSVPQGNTYDLETLFRDLNAEYFNGALDPPILCWTVRRSRRTLGRYEFDENAIVMSRYLDSPSTPLYVVRYILFHEMLHLKHGSRIEGSRERVHTPEFRRDERSFADYEAALSWLENH